MQETEIPSLSDFGQQGENQWLFKLEVQGRGALDQLGQLAGDVLHRTVQLALEPHGIQRKGPAHEKADVDAKFRGAAELVRKGGGAQGRIDQSALEVLHLPLGEVGPAQKGIELLVAAAVAGQIPEEGHGVLQKFPDVQTVRQLRGVGDGLAHDLLHQPPDIGVVGVEGGAVDVCPVDDIRDGDLLAGLLPQQFQKGTADQPPGADGRAVFLAFFHGVLLMPQIVLFASILYGVIVKYNICRRNNHSKTHISGNPTTVELWLPPELPDGGQDK